MEQHLRFNRVQNIQDQLTSRWFSCSFPWNAWHNSTSAVLLWYRQAAFGWVFSRATGVLRIPWHPIQVRFEGRHPDLLKLRKFGIKKPLCDFEWLSTLLSGNCIFYLFLYIHSRFSSWEPHASRLGSVRSSAIFLDKINGENWRALHCQVYNKTLWLGQHSMALFHPLLLWYCSLLSKAVLRWRTSKRMEGIWPP